MVDVFIARLQTNLRKTLDGTGRNIAVVKNVDLDNDNINDEVKLLLNDNLNVDLSVNSSSINVFTLTNEQQVFGDIPGDHYECDLYVCSNKIVVGRTYTFTNKYGSTASIDCYEYNSGQIKRIWSAPSDNSVRFSIVDYISNNNTIKIETNFGKRNIVLSNEEKMAYENFSSALSEDDLSPEFEYTAMPEYKIIKNDNYIEIVTRGIVICGASPVTQVYYQKYQISNDGVIEEDSWFGSEKPQLAVDYGFE